MDSYSNFLPDVGSSFSDPTEGLHIAHSNSVDAWAVYAAGNAPDIIIAIVNNGGNLAVVFLSDQPGRVGYVRNYRGDNISSATLSNYNESSGIYYNAIGWPAPTFYTGYPFNGNTDSPFEQFASVEEIVSSWIVPKEVTISWERPDGNIIETSFNIKVKRRKFTGITTSI